MRLIEIRILVPHMPTSLKGLRRAHQMSESIPPVAAAPSAFYESGQRLTRLKNEDQMKDKRIFKLGDILNLGTCP